jgi:hypothetical protein
MNQTHLSDDQLVEMHFGLASPAVSRAHLLECTACESRRLELATTLQELGDAMRAEADHAFPDERLARQRARILQRLEIEGRTARVIAFPTSPHQDGAPARPRTPARWGTVAAAVAASFIVGLLADHLAHELPGKQQSRPVTRVARQANAPTSAARPISSDDELLGQVELAASGVGPAALRPLDALTPRAWDAR